MSDKTGRLVVAITGASGAPYAVRFLQEAVKHYTEIYVALSEQALQVISIETGTPVNAQSLSCEKLLGFHSDAIRFVEKKNYFSPPASGSFRHDGMVIVPCSMGTAARIANGISDDLITRAADVCLKERRRLILVPRETPFNLIHLRNLTLLAEAGATILPASPGFYHKPQSIGDLVDFLVARILQQLGIEQKLVSEWQHED
ncbi:MAG: UbiX family flavin prenyltransferase [Chthonomonadaceae bacterium]|nr:UbiX family flavin prenyltransferase [Chthonomonadaceae bacterium]